MERQPKDGPLPLLVTRAGQRHSVGIGVGLGRRADIFPKKICRKLSKLDTSSKTLYDLLWPTSRRDGSLFFSSLLLVQPKYLRVPLSFAPSAKGALTMSALPPLFSSTLEFLLHAPRVTHYLLPSSPPSSEKSAIVVNSRNNSASSASRFSAPLRLPPSPSLP